MLRNQKIPNAFVAGLLISLLVVLLGLLHSRRAISLVAPVVKSPACEQPKVDSISPISLNKSQHQSADKEEFQRVKKMYFTVIANQEYCAGAQVLVCRLRSFSPNIPIVIIVEESVKDSLSCLEFFALMKSTVIFAPNPAADIGEVRKGTYNKLLVWDTEQYAQAGVYIDADALPVKNPESLFDLLGGSFDFAVNGDQRYFNSGVFAFRPSKQTFNELMERLKSGDYDKNNKNPTEQDLLVSHFSRLPSTLFMNQKYNFRPMHHQAGIDQNAVIVHWPGNPKPWTVAFGEETTVNGQTLNNVAHIHPNWSMVLYRCEMKRLLHHCFSLESAIAANYSCVAT